MKGILFHSKKARWLALVGLMVIFEIISLTIGTKILTLPWYELILIPFAASFIGRAVAYMTIFEWLREGLHVAHAKNHESGLGDYTEPVCKDGIISALGELITCPLCAGMWSGTILTSLRINLPEMGVPMLYMIALAGGGAALITVFHEMLEWSKAANWERAARDRRSMPVDQPKEHAEQLEMPFWTVKE